MTTKKESQPNFPPYKRELMENLIPYANNSRTHSDEQIDQIANSMREFGFTNPILVDGKNGVIAGHGRILAAKKLGMKEVPVIELSHLTEEQKRAYIIADNKLALNAGWDEDLLKVEFEFLGDAGFDLDLTGFGGDEIASIFDDGEYSTPDAVDYNQVFEIVIECDDETHQEKIYNKMIRDGYKCRVLSM